jgi:23S rRNA (adenine2030-N6)-methyltransferase
LVLCERHPDEAEILDIEFGGKPGVQVKIMDGYAAPRAYLPPPERRALMLIDPPFETQDEFARVAAAVGEGLTRLSGAVCAIWYPLTERARVDAFFAELLALKLPPTLELELTIAGENSLLKLKGCGVVVINPPWKFDAEATQAMEWLAPVLAQEPGGRARCRWLVPER